MIFGSLLILASTTISQIHPREAVPLFVETTVRFTRPGTFGDTNHTCRWTDQATAFAVELDLGGGVKKYFATAAHSLGIGITDSSLPPKLDCLKEGGGAKAESVDTTSKVKNVTITRHVSLTTLSWKVESYLHPGVDYVLLLPQRPEAFTAAKTLRLGGVPTSKKVTIWGYGSGNSYLNALEATVSDDGPSFIALNRVVLPGYSGSPVIGENEQVVGIVTSVKGEQTTALRFDTEQLKKLKPISMKTITQPRKSVYERK